jgi:hypothetical protein
MTGDSVATIMMVVPDLAEIAWDHHDVRARPSLDRARSRRQSRTTIGESRAIIAGIAHDPHDHPSIPSLGPARSSLDGAR